MLDGKTTIRHTAIIIGMWLVLAFPPLFTRDLWNPDEPRYMEVAREMVVLKQYVVPYLNGEAYPDKPPLFFWAAGLLWKLGLGVHAGQVVAGLSSLGTMLMVYFFCRRFMDPRTALWAVATLASTLMFALYAGIGVIDPVLSFLVCGTVLLGYTAMQPDTARPALWWLATYGLAGLAVLTKGPVGVLLPWLILLLFGALRQTRPATGRAWGHLAGQLLLAGIVLGWVALACKAGGPQYTFDLLVKQSAGRVASSYSHRNPFYYYLVQWPYYFFPWSLSLPLALWAAVRKRASARSGVPLLAAVWVGVYVVVFSLISGKRMGYLLPMAPAVAMLTGHYLTAGLQAHPRWRTAHLWLFGIGLGLLTLVPLGFLAGVFCAVPVAGRVGVDEEVLSVLRQAATPQRMIVAVAVLLLPLAAASAGLWLLLRRKRPVAWLLVAAVLSLFFGVQVSVVPVVNHFKSGKAFCEEAAPYLAGAKEVCLYPQDFSGVYNLYTGRVRMPVIATPSELRAALQDPEKMVIADKRHVEEDLAPAEVRAYTLMERSVGHRPMVVLGTPVPGGG